MFCMLVATERPHIYIGLNETIIEVRAEEESYSLNTIIYI